MSLPVPNFTLETAAGNFVFFKHPGMIGSFKDLPDGVLQAADQNTGLTTDLYFWLTYKRAVVEDPAKFDTTVVVRQVLDWLEEMFTTPEFQQAFGVLNWKTNTRPRGGRTDQELALHEHIVYGAGRRKQPVGPFSSIMGATSVRSNDADNPNPKPFNRIHLTLPHGVRFQTHELNWHQSQGCSGRVEIFGQTQYFVVKSPIFDLETMMTYTNIANEVYRYLIEAFPLLHEVEGYLSREWYFSELNEEVTRATYVVPGRAPVAPLQSPTVELVVDLLLGLLGLTVEETSNYTYEALRTKIMTEPNMSADRCMTIINGLIRSGHYFKPGFPNQDIYEVEQMDYDVRHELHEVGISNFMQLHLPENHWPALEARLKQNVVPEFVKKVAEQLSGALVRWYSVPTSSPVLPGTKGRWA